MSEYLVVGNPRRKRKSTRRRKTTRRRRTASGRFVSTRRHNPRRAHARRVTHHRRRRRTTRRTHRRRVRRNPSLRLGRFNLGQVFTVAAGGALTNAASNFLTNMLPAEWTAALPADAVRIGTKAVVGMLLPGVLPIPAGLKRNIVLGGGVAVAIDILNTYLAPALSPMGVDISNYTTMPTRSVLSDYSTMQGYTRQDLLGAGAFDSGAYV